MPNTITITGNITGDPELRFTNGGGIAVVSFTIADTPRFLNKQTNEWEDGETLFLRCNLWREAAENVAETLRKGTRVIATGKLKQRAWESKEGEKRVSYEIDIEEIGPSLKYATANVKKRAKNEGGGRAPTGSNAPADDPWGSYSPSSDEPPF